MPRQKRNSGRINALAELDRYKALAQMVGGYVHQLRTPIHIVRASSEDLLSRGLPSELKPVIELISRSADRMNASVTSILNFVKGEKLSLRPGGLNEILEQLGDFLQMECKKRSISVEKSLTAKQLVLLDPHPLQEALLNVLMNALQAMTKGGTLTLQTEDVRNKVILRIKDTGVGMDKKALAKLAIPFQTTKKEGLGLGVFFTRKILHQHHARLEFASEKGRGTTVTMTFPAV